MKELNSQGTLLEPCPHPPDSEGEGRIQLKTRQGNTKSCFLTANPEPHLIYLSAFLTERVEGTEFGAVQRGTSVCRNGLHGMGVGG